jgi:hypothetical protein
MGKSCEQNLDISRYITGYSGVHSLEKRSYGTHHLYEHPSALATGLQHSWKCLPWLQTSQGRHPLVTIRTSNGDISWGNPHLHHRAHKQVVKQGISLLHLEAGGAKKMLTFWSFRHIPDLNPRWISSEDPRQRNHRNNAKTRRNIGNGKS